MAIHPHVTDKQDWKYKLGFIMGYYKACGGWTSYFASEATYWNPSDFDFNDQEMRDGWEDGKSQRPANNNYLQVGNFFAYDISGFPWGSMLEHNYRAQGLALERMYSTGMDRSDTYIEWYRLKEV